MAVNIGKYIADLRTEKGMSQRELAERSGLSNTEISRLESGKRMKRHVLLLLYGQRNRRGIKCNERCRESNGNCNEH